MKLLMPFDIASRLVGALTQVGRREIGGILMGEHVDLDTFRVKEITIQRKGGTFAAFTRIVSDIFGPLRAFFEKNNYQYSKFNYLGEWHSHHSFSLKPSERDHMTMCDMVMDPELGARFILLLLIKLDSSDSLECSVIVYQPNTAPYSGIVVPELPSLEN